MKKFDLNIETILENWNVYHAIREFIANAMDEQMLTSTQPIKIFKENEVWHIKDYGRGVKYTHLTQNENQEKLSNPNVIGKFGIGLKDALATLDRHNILVEIKSRHGIIGIEKSTKQGFEDLLTLHATITDCEDNDFIGTDISLYGVSDANIESAKKLFLAFSGEEIIETTKYGQVIRKGGQFGIIYINGVKVAEEENFLFSYNITALSSQIKKAINRERSNVGRSAYSDSVKKILLNCESNSIANMLQEDMLKMDKGTHHDELKWMDIQEHAVKILNANKNVLFVNTQQIINSPELIDEARQIGMQIVNIPNSLADKIHNQLDINGGKINDIDSFVSDINANFEYDFVEYDELSSFEKQTYDLTDDILRYANLSPLRNEVRISNTLQRSTDFASAKGVCVMGSVIIKRSELSSIRAYAEVLVHEAVHAKMGYGDVTRQFELALSEIIGSLCSIIIKQDDASTIPHPTEKADLCLESPVMLPMTDEEVKIEKYVYSKIKYDFAESRLREFLYHLVVGRQLNEAEFNNRNLTFLSDNYTYEAYINDRETHSWLSNIPFAIENFVKLYSKPKKSKEEYESIDYMKTVFSYEEYLSLHDSLRYFNDMKNTFYTRVEMTYHNLKGEAKLPIKAHLMEIGEQYEILSNNIRLYTEEYYDNK